MSASRQYGRDRKSVPFDDEVVDTGAEPFDAITARADAAVEAQEAFLSDCADATAEAQWARSVDYC